MQHIQAGEIDIPAIHDIDGAGFGQQHIERVHIVQLAVGNVPDSDEGGHQFQFDRGHDSSLMAARLGSSRRPVLFMS